jgi:hypothetical protein
MKARKVNSPGLPDGRLPEKYSQDLFQEKGAAVRVDLHHLFTRVGVRRRHVGKENLIDDCA